MKGWWEMMQSISNCSKCFKEQICQSLLFLENLYQTSMAESRRCSVLKAMSVDTQWAFAITRITTTTNFNFLNPQSKTIKMMLILQLHSRSSLTWKSVHLFTNATITQWCTMRTVLMSLMQTMKKIERECLKTLSNKRTLRKTPESSSCSEHTVYWWTRSISLR